MYEIYSVIAQYKVSTDMLIVDSFGNHFTYDALFLLFVSAISVHVP